MDNKVLLIIGNGFDLHCGLHTSYLDYFNYQYKNSIGFKLFVNLLKHGNIEKLDEAFKLLKDEKNITFFDVYFTVQDWNKELLGTDLTWSNVEDMLLKGFEGGTSNNLSYHLCFVCYSRLVAYNNTNSYDFDVSYDILGQYLASRFGFNKTIDESTFNNFLLEELDKFSVNFSKFITKQVEETPNYITDAQNFIMKITGHALNECIIISFNYTEPLASPSSANIHGIASKEKIVFGITCGEKEIKQNTHNSWYYKATKEFKIAKLLANGIKVSANYEGIKDIYVYGSSLGSQDYDFYENLFEYFEFLMRSNSARIHFCYSVYGNKTREEVAEDLTIKVTNLINKFGDNYKTYGLLRSMIQKGHLDFLLIDD